MWRQLLALRRQQAARAPCGARADACQISPAREPLAITVAASDSSDTRWPYSNYGSCVDLYAPGVSIRSSVFYTTTANLTASGTSMACPHVSGVAALYLQASPAAPPAEAGRPAQTPDSPVANIVHEEVQGCPHTCQAY